MLTKVQQDLKAKIEAIHRGDQSQIDVVFSSSRRLIVEAPAGYGKTKTMISSIAYMLASNRVKNRKRILALTFSVNAAFKIRRDVADQIPSLLDINSSQVENLITNRVYVSNYHGFCRHVLRTYGALLSPALSSIDTFRGIDDIKAAETLRATGLTADANMLLVVDRAIKTYDERSLDSTRTRYLDVVLNQLVPRELITFNSIILLVEHLFCLFPELGQLYSKLYPIVIVDEFQDTNILGWRLLRSLIKDDTDLVLMGDSLQRIYGFIGAIPNLLDEAEARYHMDRTQLAKNHRFENNPEMLLLDQNIRENARRPEAPTIKTCAKVPCNIAETHEEEAAWIAEQVSSLSAEGSRVAILVAQRGTNTNLIIEALQNKGLSFFYGLFSDDDPDYIAFHNEGRSLFLAACKDAHPIEALSSTLAALRRKYEHSTSPIFASLMELLRLFAQRLKEEYRDLGADEKNSMIREMFEGRALKQNMERVGDAVVVSTIHGAKGLEWDYVILADMERYSLPAGQFCVNSCPFQATCDFKFVSSMESVFLEQLSLFYVGVTRARKQVYFTASRTRYMRDGPRVANTSCFTRLPGIVLTPA